VACKKGCLTWYHGWPCINRASLFTCLEFSGKTKFSHNTCKTDNRQSAKNENLKRRRKTQNGMNVILLRVIRVYFRLNATLIFLFIIIIIITKNLS